MFVIITVMLILICIRYCFRYYHLMMKGPSNTELKNMRDGVIQNLTTQETINMKEFSISYLKFMYGIQTYLVKNSWKDYDINLHTDLELFRILKIGKKNAVYLFNHKNTSTMVIMFQPLGPAFGFIRNVEIYSKPFNFKLLQLPMDKHHLVSHYGNKIQIVYHDTFEEIFSLLSKEMNVSIHGHSIGATATLLFLYEYIERGYNGDQLFGTVSGSIPVFNKPVWDFLEENIPHIYEIFNRADCLCNHKFKGLTRCSNQFTFNDRFNEYSKSHFLYPHNLYVYADNVISDNITLNSVKKPAIKVSS